MATIQIKLMRLVTLAPTVRQMWAEYDIGTGCLALIAGGGKDWPPGSTGVAVALEVEDFGASFAELKARG